jgi:hypothetical protein
MLPKQVPLDALLGEHVSGEFAAAVSETEGNRFL